MRTAIQFWKVGTDRSIDQLARLDDDPTGANPAGAQSFAYPSLAVTDQGNALIGFSSFSRSYYPRASWAFRRATDPPNTVTMGGVLKSGEAYINASTPWGEIAGATTAARYWTQTLWPNDMDAPGVRPTAGGYW